RGKSDEQPVVERAPVGMGVGLVGFLIVLLGIWGGLVAYLGPSIGLHRAGETSWHWTTAHTLLWFDPGVAAFAAGLLLIAFGPRSYGLGSKSIAGLASLLAIAAGLWFVVGPEAYATWQGA